MIPTDTILRLMRAKDRRALNLQTSEEAQASFVARSERELQDAIANLLTLRGITFLRFRMDKATTARRGWPDFTLALNGRAVALEAKRGSNDLDPEQVRCIAGMRKDGWDVRVVRSLDEVRGILGEGRA